MSHAWRDGWTGVDAFLTVEALVVKEPGQEDTRPSPGLWDREFDPGPSKASRTSQVREASWASRATARLFTLVILLYLVVWAVGFAFVSRVFGPGGAIALSLILVFPLVVAVRMGRRWTAVRG